MRKVCELFMRVEIVFIERPTKIEASSLDHVTKLETRVLDVTRTLAGPGFKCLVRFGYLESERRRPTEFYLGA